LSFISFAQTPGIQWQRTLGGKFNEFACLSVKTTDGNFITAGTSSSSDGMVTGHHGNLDIWVTKMTPLGSLLWQKSFGGVFSDAPVTVIPNPDNTCTIVANVLSVEGDVTGNHGGSDIWVFKLDAGGNIIWKHTYGGTGSEKAYAAIPLSGGGYLITGNTNSNNNGDVSGAKGGTDLWVFKIADDGTLLAQGCFGGTASDAGFKAKAIQKSDGSFLVGTETVSNNGDVTGNNGGSDVWILSVSSNLVLQWEKCVGGTSHEYFADIVESANEEIWVVSQTSSPNLPSFHGTTTDYEDFLLARLSPAGALITQKCFGGTIGDRPFTLIGTPDNGVVMAGRVYNGGGDVQGYHGAFSGGDIWIVKVKTDFSIEWQRTLGGTSDDNIQEGFSESGVEASTGNIIQTSDNGFLITGYTGSDNTGDVTGFHLPVTDSSTADVWVMKLSSTGVLQWQKCMGGNKGEWPRGAALELGPNEYIITAHTGSNTGDVNGNNGSYDYWLVKLGAVNTIKGRLFYDANSNGVKDPAESYFSRGTVTATSSSDTKICIPSTDGSFLLYTDIGSYTVTVSLNEPYFAASPASRNVSFTSYFNTDSSDIAIQPLPGKKDLVLNLFSLSPARPGFEIDYKLAYTNAGTVSIPSGSIVLNKDPRLTLMSAFPVATTIVGDKITWDYANLAPSDTAGIKLHFKIAAPPVTQNGDTLKLLAFIDPVTDDLTPSNDTASLKQVVVGSYDPNDKTEINAGKITPKQVTDGDYLTYVIRFQNTGTDTAFNITVTDTLDSKLDWNSLQMLSASHVYRLRAADGNKLSWTFDDIKLADSNHNEPASHGYIAYRIKPIITLAEGDIINNTAAIYFDFNLPVQTNRQQTLVGNVVPLPVTLGRFQAYLKRDKTVQVEWQSLTEINTAYFEVERSANGLVFTPIGKVPAKNAAGGAAYSLVDNKPANGINYYRLKTTDADGKKGYSVVVKINLDEKPVILTTLYPNPAGKQCRLDIKGAVKGNASIALLSNNGQVVLTKDLGKLDADNVTVPIGIGNLAPGVYILRLQVNATVYKSRLVIQ
jgi:uncharacterized repeat protein (TIGR01451 family)